MSNREEKELKKSFVQWMCVGLGIALMFLFLKRDNIVRWAEASLVVESQHRTMESNSAKIDGLESRIADLRTNLDTLETFARESLGFAAPGDEVYLIQDR